MIGQDLIDPVEEGVKELGIVLQPGGVEVQTQWGAILIVMAIEVVIQEVVELITGQNVRAGVNHSAARQVLIIGRILTTIQFVHDHLPDSMRARGAALQVAVAAMGHAEVHGVGPQWGVRQGRRDGGVIEEGLLLHHGELIVATHTQVRSTHTHNRIVCNVRILLNDDPHASHLLGPVINGGVRPETFLIVVRDRVHGNLVTLARSLLHGGVVGVLVGEEVGGLDVAAVGVLATLEDLLVQLNVVVVDGIIERDGDHHGHILGGQIAGNRGAVLRAEAVGQHAHSGIAGWSTVGIVVNVCKREERMQREMQWISMLQDTLAKSRDCSWHI